MMLVTEKIDKVLKNAKEEVKNLEVRYHLEVAQKEQLADDLGIARGEIEDLRKKLKRMDKENAKLKEQLSLLQEKQDGGGQGVLGQNGNVPLDIFPEEIWNMIFGYLKNPRDLKSCYETCVDFQDMLENKKEVFLFVDVVKLVSPFLSKPELMRCRLACSHWKESVDSYLQRDPEIFNCEPRWDTAKSLDYYRGRLGDINAEINPIPTRYLRYLEGSRDYDWFEFDNHEPRNSISDSLQLYGNYAWFFKAGLDRSGYSSASAFMYGDLREWLSLMPNLKGLYLHQPLNNNRNWWKGYREYHIDIDTDYNTDSDNDSPRKIDYYGSDYDNKMALRNLKEESAANPFSVIPSLKTVVFEDCPPRLVRSVFMSNPQIERLQVKRHSTNLVKFLYEPEMEMLKEASFTIHRKMCDELRYVGWNLRKLSLLAPNVTKLGDTFEILEENFARTLVELDLTLGEISSLELRPRLNLPNLKRFNFKAKLRRFFSSIDFVLPLFNLEYLTVAIEINNDPIILKFDNPPEEDAGSPAEIKCEPTDIAETIQYHHVDHDMKRSNIWKLLPKLKMVNGCYRCDSNAFDSDK